jgi:N-acetyltransferase 10
LYKKLSGFVTLSGLQFHVTTYVYLNQVCLEGEVSKNSIVDGLSRGKRASGDLIPWTVAQQFQDEDFPMLSGARVVRIATHPDYQGV